MEEDRLWYQIFVFDGKDIVEILLEATQDHIWQHDAFSVAVVDRSDDEGHHSGEEPLYIGGCLRYGDNVEDEWIALSLLYEITRIYPNTIARAWDCDGEVLLIEAADFLPTWLEPETSVNRVFIANGQLHLVPLPSASAPISKLPKEPTLRQGLTAVRNSVLDKTNDASRSSTKEQSPNYCDTCAPEDIQSAINRRMEGLPGRSVVNERHWSRCVVPVGVALLLRERPQLVSAAVRRFYERGPEELRAATARARFGSDRWVLERVQFTRCLYAQLCKQPFYPPKGYPPLPEPSHPQYKWRTNGIKLACAMEMLYARDPTAVDEPACFTVVDHSRSMSGGTCRGEHEGRESESINETQPAAIARGAEWERFRRSLEGCGYFRNELEGSAQHRILLQRAKDFFGASSVPRRASPTSLSVVMDELLKRATLSTSIEVGAEGCVGEPLEVLCGGDTRGDDSENWLEMGPEDMDRLLSDIEKRHNSKAESASEYGNAETSGAPETIIGSNVLEQMVDGMDSFGRRISSFKGAEVPAAGSHDAVRSVHDPVDLDAERLIAQFSTSGKVGRHSSGAGFKDGQVDEGGDSGSSSGSSASDWDRDWDDGQNPESDGADEGAGEDGVQYEQGLEGLGLRELMALMDAELSQSSLSQDFERIPPIPNMKMSSEATDIPSESEQAAKAGPVDVDANLVKNLLESYKAQAGLAGPASSLYGLMGVRLPDDADKH